MAEQSALNAKVSGSTPDGGTGCNAFLYMKITSRQNPTIKYIAKLKTKKHRDKTHKMLIEGYYPVFFAIQNNYTIDQLFICPELFSKKLDNKTLINIIERKKIVITNVSKSVFAKIGHSKNPAGLLAIAPQKRNYLKNHNVATNGLYIAVESIEQLNNLGAIIRLADNVSASGVLISNMRADVYSPKTIESSLGAFFSIDILLCSTKEAIIWCKNNNIKILATSPKAPVVYTDVNMKEPIAVIVGAEHEGLSKDWLKKADVKVKIPMYGQVNSLSVSASTAVILYEALRQRQNA